MRMKNSIIQEYIQQDVKTLQYFITHELLIHFVFMHNILDPWEFEMACTRSNFFCTISPPLFLFVRYFFSICNIHNLRHHCV